MQRCRARVAASLLGRLAIAVTVPTIHDHSSRHENRFICTPCANASARMQIPSSPSTFNLFKQAVDISARSTPTRLCLQRADRIPKIDPVARCRARRFRVPRNKENDLCELAGCVRKTTGRGQLGAWKRSSLARKTRTGNSGHASARVARNNFRCKVCSVLQD